MYNIHRRRRRIIAHIQYNLQTRNHKQITILARVCIQKCRVYINCCVQHCDIGRIYIKSWSNKYTKRRRRRGKKHRCYYNVICGNCHLKFAHFRRPTVCGAFRRRNSRKANVLLLSNANRCRSSCIECASVYVSCINLMYVYIYVCSSIKSSKIHMP